MAAADTTGTLPPAEVISAIVRSVFATAGDYRLRPMPYDWRSLVWGGDDETLSGPERIALVTDILRAAAANGLEDPESIRLVVPMERTGFATLLDVAETMLEAYPAAIFADGSPNVGPGVRFVTELRRAIAECRLILANTSPVASERTARTERVGLARHPGGYEHFGDEPCLAPGHDRTGICHS